MKKIIELKLLIFIVLNITFFVVNSSAQNPKNKLNVKDYLELLTDDYIICPLENCNCEKIEDLRNGYISYKKSGDAEAFFQMALFKNYKKQNFFVIHSLRMACADIFDCANTERITHFLKYENNKWVNIKSVIMPEISSSLFYDNSENVKILNKHNGYLNYKYELPRKGTTVKLEIVICDYITEEITNQKYEKLIKEKKIRYLKWNKKLTKFQFVK